jgi:hypothetical protein
LVDEAKTIGVAGTETMSVPVGVEGDPVVEVGPEDVVDLLDDVDVPVEEETAQEQAEEMRDGDPEHMETKVGSPVVAVFTAVVYVPQKAVTAELVGSRTWRKQLS